LSINALLTVTVMKVQAVDPAHHAIRQFKELVLAPSS
jgi:hypothetical protein